MAITIADADDLAIVLVDVQPLFLESMYGAPEPLLTRLEQLLIIAGWFELPVIATLEEPVDRKGQLPEPLRSLLPANGRMFTKSTYDLCGEPEIRTAVERSGRTQFAVAGGETDVCVLQSVLGLRRLNFDVFLLEDCLCSSEPRTDHAIRRMEQAGAIPGSYKSLFYELCGTDDPSRWQDQRANADRLGFVPPESLPPRSR